MRANPVVLGVTAAVLAALAGCTSPEPDNAATVVPNPSVNPAPVTRGPPLANPAPSVNAAPPVTPSATPIFGSTLSSALTARTVTRYVPPAGVAPPQSFAVGRLAVTLNRGGKRPLPVRVWYPATGSPDGDPTDNPAPAPGLFPVVLFSHGLTSQPDDYAAMLVRWAQVGFVVAAPTYPHTSYGAADYDPSDVVNQPADASFVLTHLLEPTASQNILAGHLDAARIGAAGHSAGGITTAGLFSSQRDDRLRAGIVLAGTDFAAAPFAGPAAALLFVHGKEDRSIAYGAGRTVFQAVPWSRAMLTVTNGGHVMSGEDFEAITGTTTEFLRWSLYGDSSAKGRLAGRAAVNGVATLDEQL